MKPTQLRLCAFLVCGLGVFLLDFFSKQWIWQTRPDLQGDSLLYFIEFQFHRNSGLMLGIGKSLDASTLSLVSAIMLLGLGAFFVFHNFTGFATASAWGSVIGGGLANAYERIQTSAVTDFLQFQLAGIQSGIFNLADLFNLLGLLALATLVLFKSVIR